MRIDDFRKLAEKQPGLLQGLPLREAFQLHLKGVAYLDELRVSRQPQPQERRGPSLQEVMLERDKYKKRQTQCRAFFPQAGNAHDNHMRASVARAIAGNNIRPEDLSTFSERRLLALPNIGRKSVEYLRRALSEKGMALAPEPYEPFTLAAKWPAFFAVSVSYA